MAFFDDLFSRQEGKGNLLDPAGLTTGQDLGIFNNYYAQQAPLEEGSYLSGINKTLGNFDQNRAQNQQFINALQQQMSGQGPSVAMNQLNQTTAQNIGRGSAQYGSMKGIDPALAAKLTADASANQQQLAAGQGATLRAQEQMGASGQLGSFLGNQNQQDVSQLSALGGLQNQQNQNRIQNLAQQQAINEKVMASKAQQKSNLIGGAMSGIGAMFGAEGGEVPGMQEMNMGSPESIKKDFMQEDPSKDKKEGGISSLLPLLAMLAEGGEITDNEIEERKIKKGNSFDNDVVPAMLSPGEIVLPRTVTQSKDAAENAKKFVEMIKSTHKPNEKVEYSHVLDSHRRMKEMVEHYMCGGKVY